MIRTFGNKLTEDLFNGVNSKEARKFPHDLHRSVQRKLTLIDAAATVEDLSTPPGNRLEKKEGNLKDYWSIRINDQWRILFKWENNHAEDVQIVDYH